jgi:hypothetical protein
VNSLMDMASLESLGIGMFPIPTFQRSLRWQINRRVFGMIPTDGRIQGGGRGRGVRPPILRKIFIFHAVF